MRFVPNSSRTQRRTSGSRYNAVAVALLTLSLGACDGAGAAGGNGAGDVTADTALRRLAADLLPAAEMRSGLLARGPIQLATRSREDLEAFLVAQMAEQMPPDRLEAVVRTYARLGLVPETIDLEPLLRSLLLEQV
ncbi:MAG: hypothetical protein WBO43_05335, partial [Gemmatimonadota bacterium]